MKLILKKISYLFIKILYIIPKKITALFSIFHSTFKDAEYDFFNSSIDNTTISVVHVTRDKIKVELEFFTPNPLCAFRANTFSTKEPETLEWIEEFGKNGAVLYDIGSNVGIYSIYHSVINQGEVFSFEPSFFNLKILAKNINLNDSQELITVISTPLSAKNQINNFKYKDPIEGGALSVFGQDFGFDGNKIDSNLSVKVIGQTLDSLVSDKTIGRLPNFIKIDVDGIEHLILSGAITTLKQSSCKSILVEVNDNFEDQALKVKSILEGCGYVLRNKLHSKMFDDDEVFSNTYNQIWIRR